MAIISVRVSDDLKKRMKKFPYINWSEIVRRELNRFVEKLEGKNMAIALLINERVRKKSDKDVAEIVKAWRKQAWK